MKIKCLYMCFAYTWLPWLNHAAFDFEKGMFVYKNDIKLLFRFFNRFNNISDMIVDRQKTSKHLFCVIFWAFVEFDEQCFNKPFCSFHDFMATSKRIIYDASLALWHCKTFWLVPQDSQKVIISTVDVHELKI